MKQYTVTGMSCAACSARVGEGRERRPGRHELLGQPADELPWALRALPSSADIIKAVVDAGYGASEKGAGAEKKSASSSMAEAEAALEDHETPVLKRRPDLVRRLPHSAHVFLHGRHDVGLAAAGFPGLELHGPGAHPSSI